MFPSNTILLTFAITEPFVLFKAPKPPVLLEKVYVASSPVILSVEPVPIFKAPYSLPAHPLSSVP